jgi:hypothetical protein
MHLSVFFQQAYLLGVLFIFWWTCVSGGGSTYCRITETTYEITYENCGLVPAMSSSDDDGLCQPTDDNIPIIEPELDDFSNPCRLKKLVEDNPEIFNKLTGLVDKVGLNKEVGYVMTESTNGSFDFTYIEGEEDEHRIDFSIMGNIAGVIHTHFEGGLSVPSDGDIESFYQAYPNMENAKTFFFAIVTSQETSYLLNIKDKLKFESFGAKYLADANSGFSRFFAESYRLAVSNSNSIVDNEKNLVELLSHYDSGIALVRGDISDFNHWTRLTQNIYDGSIKEKDCK